METNHNRHNGTGEANKTAILLTHHHSVVPPAPPKVQYSEALNKRYAQLRKKSKEDLVGIFGQYHRVHSADTRTPKGDLIAGILEAEGLTRHAAPPRGRSANMSVGQEAALERLSIYIRNFIGEQDWQDHIYMISDYVGAALELPAYTVQRDLEARLEVPPAPPKKTWAGRSLSEDQELAIDDIRENYRVLIYPDRSAKVQFGSEQLVLWAELSKKGTLLRAGLEPKMKPAPPEDTLNKRHIMLDDPPAPPDIDKVKWIGDIGVRKYNIIGTNVMVFDVYEPGKIMNTHSSITNMGGFWYGQIGSRMLPPDLDALPAWSDERLKAVGKWHEEQYQEAYGYIEKAFPEAKGGSRSMGTIAIKGNKPPAPPTLNKTPTLLDAPAPPEAHSKKTIVCRSSLKHTHSLN